MSIGVGFIGLSAARGWAANAHLPALRALPGEFEIRALSGSTPESARAAAEAHGVPISCADHRELVARSDVDLVVVTVKVPEHHRLVTAAIDAGKAVLCEWPLGNGLAEAEELTARAAERGLRTFVGLQARSAPAFRFVRDLVREGAVGEVLSTTVVGSGEGWGPVVWPTAEYLVDRDNGATMLTIPFGHAIDGVCFALGEFAELTATTATRRPVVHHFDSGAEVPMTAEDQVAVTGTLEGGAVASLHYRGGRSTGTNFLWEVNGTAGDLVVRGDRGQVQHGQVDVFLGKAGGQLEPQPVPERYHTTSTDPATPSHAVAEAYAQIAQDLRTGSTSAPTFADALRRHRMLAAVQQAAATGQRQSLA